MYVHTHVTLRITNTYVGILANFYLNLGISNVTDAAAACGTDLKSISISFIDLV